MFDNKLILLINMFFVHFCICNIDKVIEEHIEKLQNLNKKQPALAILFSATPGMGKTTLANKLESELCAIKITLDDARNLLKSHQLYPKGSNEDKINFIMNYFNKLLLKIRKISKNRLIILDDSVDIMHDKIIEVLKKHNYKTFLIRIKATKKIAIERIKKREKYPNGYLNNMDYWLNNYNNFNLKLVDYFFENYKNKEMKIDLLIKKIKYKLKKINKRT